MPSVWPRSGSMVSVGALRLLPRVSRKGCVVSAHFNVFARKGGTFFMLETNMRVVGSGMALRLAVRLAQVEGTEMSPDLLQKLCGSVRQRHGVAAVPDPRASNRLIVATKRPIEPLQLASDDWEVGV